MNRNLKLSLVALAILVAGSLCFAGGGKEAAAPQTIRVAMVVKNLGNSFFEACRDGGLEAAKEIGGVELIYQGPSTPTAEGQIEIIDSLIAQRVKAIAISANDVDALVPIAKKAMNAGIKVISFDSGIAKEGRILHLAPSGDEFIGRSQVRMMAEMVDYKGGLQRGDCHSQRFLPGYQPERLDRVDEEGAAEARLQGYEARGCGLRR